MGCSESFIYGYAEVQPQYLDWFAKEFSGALLGLAIDGAVASQDFDDSPRRSWNEMAQVDGHDTLYVKSSGIGNGTLVTWGGLQTFTKAFRENNVTDSWVIFDQYDLVLIGQLLRLLLLKFMALMYLLLVNKLKQLKNQTRVEMTTAFEKLYKLADDPRFVLAVAAVKK